LSDILLSKHTFNLYLCYYAR